MTFKRVASMYYPGGQPEVTIPEQMAMGLNETKIGQKVQVIMNYRVIEKTRSFTILQITGVHPVSKARRY